MVLRLAIKTLMKNRTELAKEFARRGYTKGAEIGVYVGYYSRLLLDAIPNLNLLCVDSWATETWRKRAYPLAVETLSYYPNVTIIRGKSIDVAKTIEDESLDFVFIDADHSYKSVKDDLLAWTPKVRPGGIVSGHDYYESHSKKLGVIRAVNEYVKEHGYVLQLTEWDKENPVRDDRQPSWYFDK
jgi:predicted O-methyltransferase YrrM